jgi:Putative Ig domain
VGVRLKRRILVPAFVATAALVFATAAWAIRFTDESYFPPVGKVGVPYSFAFTGAGGCGPALPYQFTVLGGSPPPGLSLAKSGLVSGTPTQAGRWSFWVNLSDENPPSADWCRPAQAQREFTITIQAAGGGVPPPPPPIPVPPPPAPISITTSTLPEATSGSPYSTTLTASGSAGKSWSISAGSLPAGLSLASSGVLNGTPTAPGTSSFTVKVTAGGATSQKQFTLDVIAPLQIGAAASQVGEVAVPITVDLAASGGTAPYRWELTQGSLPTHVGFIGDKGNGSAATIKGVPAEAGDFPLTFAVVDVRGRRTVRTITLQVADKLRFVAVQMPRRARIGKVFRASCIAEGGIGTDTWSVIGKLPTGLALDPVTGVISGRPLRRGRYVFYLGVKDELGASRSMKISIVVRR